MNIHVRKGPHSIFCHHRKRQRTFFGVITLVLKDECAQPVLHFFKRSVTQTTSGAQASASFISTGSRFEVNWQVYKQCVPISNNSGAQTQSQVQGTVVPADIASDTPAPEIGSESHHGCQIRTLRAVDDPPFIWPMVPNQVD